MIVYIAGPMTNVPQFNRPAFFAAAERLSAAGDIPLNPQFFRMPYRNETRRVMRIGLGGC
ncbi:DUF4406 domain-containing protein [Klebsiella aerogenes]